jgi:uncharacterized protein YndB with AHSA1/START domain
VSVINIEKDPAALSMTVTAEFEASVDRAWQLWADPRQLERWWGPPTFPATVVDHDLVPGGRVSYYMTGPAGEQPRGWWQVRDVEPPHRLTFEDGFADASGSPDPTMPTMQVEVTLDQATPATTRMVIRSTFASAEQMDQLISMGMEEGMAEALGQIDTVLASV